MAATGTVCDWNDVTANSNSRTRCTSLQFQKHASNHWKVLYLAIGYNPKTLPKQQINVSGLKSGMLLPGQLNHPFLKPTEHECHLLKTESKMLQKQTGTEDG